MLHKSTHDPALACRKIEMESTRNESEARMRLLSTAMVSAGSATLITDRAGHITWATPAVERLTRYCLAECLGQTPRLFKSGKHEPAFYRGL